MCVSTDRPALGVVERSATSITASGVMETLRRVFADYRNAVLLKNVIAEWRVLAEFSQNETDLYRRNMCVAMFFFRLEMLAEKYGIPTTLPEPGELIQFGQRTEEQHVQLCEEFLELKTSLLRGTRRIPGDIVFRQELRFQQPLARIGSRRRASAAAGAHPQPLARISEDVATESGPKASAADGQK